MNITKEYNEKELTIFVEGRVDTNTSKDLENEINSELGNFDILILDFNELTYISSSGLRVLISTQKKMTPDNIPFIIKNVNGSVKDVLEMSGFDQILRIE